MDEEEFLLFYDKDEIESTKDMQVYDAFEDIKEVKDECLLNGIVGNKNLNKIAIEEFAPKEIDYSNLSQKNKRSKKSKSMKSS